MSGDGVADRTQARAWASWLMRVRRPMDARVAPSSEKQHSCGDRDRADSVEAPGCAVRAVRSRQHHRREDQDQQGDRHREGEHQSPTELGQQPGGDESAAVSGGAGQGVDAERSVALRAFGERSGDE